MAYPQIESTATTVNVASVNHNINLPSGIQEGDLLIIVTGAVVAFTITGWTRYAFDSGTGLFVYTRTAGTSEGSTVATSTLASSRRLAAIAYRISGWHGFEIATQGRIELDSTPALNPAWSAEDTLWLLPALGHQTDWSFSEAPSGWSGFIHLFSDSTGGNTGFSVVQNACCYKEGPSGNYAGGDKYSISDPNLVYTTSLDYYYTIGIKGTEAASNNGVRITGIKEPNVANQEVTDVSNARVKVWYGSDDTGEEDELFTAQSITNGTLEVQSVGGTIDGAATVEVMWTVGTERKLFIAETTVVDLGSGS
jgi:hypothetical protein